MIQKPNFPNIEIDFFRPSDAVGVARLFLEVYGHDYPIKVYTTPELLIEENKTGRIISSVARTEQGEIVGHVALFLSAPYKKSYESGAGLILPAYRGLGLNGPLLAHSFQKTSQRFEMEEIFGEAVCNHILMQKTSQNLGARSGVLEVDLMPASTYQHEKSATGRVSVMLGFITVKPKPHSLYLPSIYSSQLKTIYAGLEVERTFLPAQDIPPKHLYSRGQMEVMETAGMARISLSQIGDDFSRFIGAKEKEAREKKAEVIQVLLPLGIADIGYATEILRSQGFFLGGPLPRWFDTDGFLMQKVFHIPDWGSIKTYSPQDHLLLELTKEDWEKTGR